MMATAPSTSARLDADIDFRLDLEATLVGEPWTRDH